MSLKCKEKDCKGCQHYIDLRTHPLFRDWTIRGRDNKPIDFQGCKFDLGLLFLLHIWIGIGGVEAASNSDRNETVKSITKLTEFFKDLASIGAPNETPGRRELTRQAKEPSSEAET